MQTLRKEPPPINWRRLFHVFFHWVASSAPYRLFQKLKHALRQLVGLGHHRGGGLAEDVVLGEFHHLLGHVDVAAAGFARLSSSLPRRLRDNEQQNMIKYSHRGYLT